MAKTNANENVINITDVIEAATPEVEMAIAEDRGFAWGKFAVGVAAVVTVAGLAVKGVQAYRAHKAKKAEENADFVDNVKVAEHDALGEASDK